MTIGGIEDLIIARIKAELPALRRVESYSDKLVDELLAEYGSRLPAVLVVLREVRQEPVDFGQYEARHGFGVVVLTSRLRSDAEGRAGAYEILDGLRAALADYIMDSALQPCILGDIEDLGAPENMAAYGMAVEITGYFEGSRT